MQQLVFVQVSYNSCFEKAALVASSFPAQFELLMLMFKALNNSGLKYLKDDLLPYRPSWVLRSMEGPPLVVPLPSDVMAPKLWNTLLTELIVHLW